MRCNCASRSGCSSRASWEACHSMKQRHTTASSRAPFSLSASASALAPLWASAIPGMNGALEGSIVSASCASGLARRCRQRWQKSYQLERVREGHGILGLASRRQLSGRWLGCTNRLGNSWIDKRRLRPARVRRNGTLGNEGGLRATWLLGRRLLIAVLHDGHVDKRFVRPRDGHTYRGGVRCRRGLVKVFLHCHRRRLPEIAERGLTPPSRLALGRSVSANDSDQPRHIAAPKLRGHHRSHLKRV
jgi:hypothetical protein